MQATGSNGAVSVSTTAGAVTLTAGGTSGTQGTLAATAAGADGASVWTTAPNTAALTVQASQGSTFVDGASGVIIGQATLGTKTPKVAVTGGSTSITGTHGVVVAATDSSAVSGSGNVTCVNCERQHSAPDRAGRHVQ